MPIMISVGIQLNLIQMCLKDLIKNLMQILIFLNLSIMHFLINQKSRIEMHLVSKVEQSVDIFNEKIFFKKGESIHTENSYKYSTNKFEALISKSGFKKNVFLQIKKTILPFIYYKLFNYR